MRPVIFFLLLLVGTVSCKNSFESVQKSKDYEFKLSKADEYFNKKEYTKANTLYDELLPIFKGTKKFEGMYYRYAYTFFYNKNYLPASYHFKNFTDLFPKSDKAEECEYLNSLCLFKMSPNYQLDQSNTVKSIGEMQEFINMHPDSKQLTQANAMIDQSREKLEQKDRYSAELYFKIKQYKAATIAFENVIRKYPDSKFSDYYHFMIVKAYFPYAGNSIPENQAERFNRVVSDSRDFKEKFPKSTYLSEINKINGLSLQSLKKLSKS
ncbi:MAG: outer membrane protein assembly factor BamD [Chitinophagaceae bacterium]|nr:outer membrane protein assembly factor BamD [Chitinophagaceae bacterium]